MTENSVFEMLQIILSATNMCHIREINLRQIAWMIHAAFIGRLVRNGHKVLAGKLDGKENFGAPNAERSMLLEVGFKRIDYPYVEWVLWLGIGFSGGFCDLCFKDGCLIS